MAVTKIWGVKRDLPRVIRYAANPSKTWNENYKAAAQLHQKDGRGKDGLETVLQYTANEMKTEQQLFVSGINCSSDPAVAAEQMKKSLLRSTRGEYVCFHGYQSFLTGEVTPIEAHRIGIELAERVWGDRFEVLVSTHVNTRTVHCHFVVAACSFTDGGRYLANQTTYAELRRASDEICRAHGLSVLTHPRRWQEKCFSEIKAEEEGRLTIRGGIRKDIDTVLSHQTSFRFFWRELESMGYTLEYRGSFLRIKPDHAKRFIRLDKLGEGCAEEDIRIRLEKNRQDPEKRRLFAPYRKPQKKRAKGLAALYLYYCYLLHEMPKLRSTNREILAVMREDLKKLDRYSEEAKLLDEYQVNTAEELKTLQDRFSKEFYHLCTERKRLRNSLRRMSGGERMQEVKGKISELSDRICRLRRKTALCAEIAERSACVQAVVEELETGEKNMQKSR